MTDQPPGGSYPPPESAGEAPSGGFLTPSAPPPAPRGEVSFDPPPVGGSATVGGSTPDSAVLAAPATPAATGGYPPPPPAAGAVAPPPPGPAIRELPSESYTPWATRAVAFLIDYAPVLIVYAVAFAISKVTEEEKCGYPGVAATCWRQESMIGVLANWLAYLAIAAYVIWNYGYKQGTTGSSIGKSIMKFKVVSEVSGQPLGFGMSLVRQIAHLVDAIICYIGFLFPLWDKKRQTLADKIMTTVCLPL
ncbi:RDD family protein [Mycobacterium kiyosense]